MLLDITDIAGRSWFRLKIVGHKKKVWIDNIKEWIADASTDEWLYAVVLNAILVANLHLLEKQYEKKKMRLDS